MNSSAASRSMFTAMVGAGAVTAQFVGGKATRDALFLASLDLTALPAMLVATSAASILLVAANSRAARSYAPSVLFPICFAVSGALFLVEWFLASRLPVVAAVIVYLHISGAGPLLGSGFWLIASERFDPRTAKQRFGQIAAAGTLGGLISALLAERIGAWFGVAAMLPFFAVFHLASAVLVRRLAIQSEFANRPSRSPRRPAAVTPRSGLRIVAETSYLRHLASLVLLGTTSAALLDYLFKAEAVEALGRSDNLLRFFAVFYAASSLLTFVVQAMMSRKSLERFGLALTTSTPSLATVVGGVAGIVVPGFVSILLARVGESVFRGSLFRSGYELFYTPIPAVEKRAAKSIIDVGFDRLGDAVGGGLVRAVLLIAPGSQYMSILLLAMGCSALAVVAASRLNKGYVQTLEKSLLNRAVEIDLSDVEDVTTRTLVLQTLPMHLPGMTTSTRTKAPPTEPPRFSADLTVAVDAEVQDILRLRSRDRDKVVEILRRETGLTPALVAHAIPLLAWDHVAEDVVFGLRKVAEERIGQLVDALIDPNQDFAVRRRLARVFSVCVSQRAADGVILGLDDLRFEVRYHCARSLAAIVEKNPRVVVDTERILTIVLREAAVGKPMWESRRLLDEGDAPDGMSMVDAFVRDRASQSLAHVFSLLSLVLPREPLQIAFHSLHSDDAHLQGTALEYLEGVLPPQVRRRLWPFVEDRRSAGRAAPPRPREEILADLMRSNQSIMISLEELRRRRQGA